MSLALYAHALRAARPRQLARRLTRPVRRRLIPGGASGGPPRPLGVNEALWRSEAFAAAPSAPDGALMEFTLNYGNDVLDAARSGEVDRARKLIDGWMDSSPARPDVRWHPYVLSTRVSNWVAAITLEPEIASSRVGESIRRQLSYLRRNVENDILGNHVLRNAKALMLGGAAVSDAGSLQHGLRLLRRELPEQVLNDGGHYERSPAYHRLVLRDLLELSALTPIDEVIGRMQAFASSSSRPDGAPALFNDGGLDVAPLLDLAVPPDGLSVHAETGYAFLRRGGVWLAFDCGAPAPAYLPAHAHADSLSFQLWVDGRAAVVDPGTSTYEPGSVRAWERGTEAHSTLAVDGDHFHVWGSFRSGPLPRVRLVEADEQVLVGEAVLTSGVRIVRSLRLAPGELLIEDKVSGNGNHDVVSSIPLAPGSGLRVEPLAGDAELEERWVSERFGEREQATAAVLRTRATLPWENGWRVTWDATGS